MDVTSLLYFIMTADATFIFNLNIFIEKSGFLMVPRLIYKGSFSLIIKQPYTF